MSIQHDFEIWGGVDGGHVVDFLRALRVPVVATLHSILGVPTPGQRAILTTLVEEADATVVMSDSAARLLGTAYGIDPGRVEVIPHGVPELPLVDPETVKPAVNLQGRTVLLSFGLLRPGKGYEFVIDALPAVVAANPSVLYVVVGATHPDVIRIGGETYRNGLVEQVRRLGLQEHVLFLDHFVGRLELSRWLEAADVFLTPYTEMDKSASGSLSYAMSAGRAIVSTSFLHASEMLADGRGLLVQAGSPAALATAVNALLDDDDLRAAIGQRAHDHTRGMIWTAVGAGYSRLFADVTGGARSARRAQPLEVAHA